jgi:predicted RNase H-like HicB family nuclease
MARKKTIDASRYPMEIWWSDEDRCYLAEVFDLPGCMGHGATEQAAAANAHAAAELWIEVAREDGRRIPEPSLTSKPASGVFNARLPRWLHQQLQRRAARERVSLNSLVISLLAAHGSVGRDEGS